MYKSGGGASEAALKASFSDSSFSDSPRLICHFLYFIIELVGLPVMTSHLASSSSPCGKKKKPYLAVLDLLQRAVVGYSEDSPGVG